MTKFYPPQFKAKQFHCAICHVYAKQSFSRLLWRETADSTTPVWRSFCDHCYRSSYWWADSSDSGRLLMPEVVGAPPAHEHMPDDVRDDYNEAASISGRSTRGAAALLRLAIQRLMPHLGQSGDNINKDIGALVQKGLPVQVQQALDYCRVVGNNAVHPGEIDLQDTPQMVWTMFEMLNFIVQDRIAGPKELAEMFAKLPQGARDAIEKRDGKPEAKPDA